MIGSVFVASIDGVPESASLMLHGENGVAYYHLTGNAMVRPKTHANDLLVLFMANYARGLGMMTLHLGGGVTSAPDDSVLAYKQGFSNAWLPTYSYFRVLDEHRYEQLCEAKKAQELEQTGAVWSASTFLPMYRREAA
jgi:hypothetical protein